MAARFVVFCVVNADADDNPSTAAAGIPRPRMTAPGMVMDYDPLNNSGHYSLDLHDPRQARAQAHKLYPSASIPRRHLQHGDAKEVATGGTRLGATRHAAPRRAHACSSRACACTCSMS